MTVPGMSMLWPMPTTETSVTGPSGSASGGRLAAIMVTVVLPGRPSRVYSKTVGPGLVARITSVSWP